MSNRRVCSTNPGLGPNKCLVNTDKWDYNTDKTNSHTNMHTSACAERHPHSHKP